jgi:hypothetical protein
MVWNQQIKCLIKWLIIFLSEGKALYKRLRHPWRKSCFCKVTTKLYIPSNSNLTLSSGSQNIINHGFISWGISFTFQPSCYHYFDGFLWQNHSIKNSISFSLKSLLQNKWYKPPLFSFLLRILRKRKYNFWRNGSVKKICQKWW